MRVVLVTAMALLGGVAQAQIAVGKPYKIESDPAATYYNLEFGGSGALRTIVTKREGKSGTSYAKREIDCNARTFRYLGEGDTLAEAKRTKGNFPMGPLTDRSISSYVADQACASYQRRAK